MVKKIEYATYSAVVQPVDLRNRDNSACRGRLHRTPLGTILVKRKMCSRGGQITAPWRCTNLYVLYGSYLFTVMSILPSPGAVS